MSRIVRARVHTKAHHEKVEETGLDEYEIWVTVPPANNEANEAMIDALAFFLEVPSGSIRIKSGHKSRHKLIEIDESPE